MFKVLAASVRKGPASFSSAVKKKKMLEWNLAEAWLQLNLVFP